MPRWLVLTLLIVAAIACYSVGFVAGFGFFLFVGVVFELMFWVKLINRKNKS